MCRCSLTVGLISRNKNKHRVVVNGIEFDRLLKKTGGNERFCGWMGKRLPGMGDGDSIADAGGCQPFPFNQFSKQFFSTVGGKKRDAVHRRLQYFVRIPAAQSVMDVSPLHCRYQRVNGGGQGDDVGLIIA